MLGVYKTVWVCAQVYIYNENNSMSVYYSGREMAAFSLDQACSLFLQIELLEHIHVYLFIYYLWLFCAAVA